MVEIESEERLDSMRDQFEDMVSDKINELISGGTRRDKRRARRLRRVLDNEARFEFAFQTAFNSAKLDHSRGPKAQEVFTNGDFLDWFQDGGWETILKFVEGLIELLGPLFGLV